MDAGMSASGEFEFTVKKYATHIPVSDDLLWDTGVYVGPSLPPTVPTRWQRLRSWSSRKVTAFRLRLGSWVAGVDLGDDGA